MKKIIVAGGGHGGIAAAALLAKEGMDVTVYERHAENQMGYDWTDIFDKNGLTEIGLDLPPKEMYKFKENMTFYGPSQTKALKQCVPEDELEIQMERRDIYSYIINYARDCGVKFCFETEIISPIILGNRVCGINTSKGNVYADLVIDACGINSPVRRNLPKNLCIQNETSKFDQFYVYRAFFNKASDEFTDRYKVLMLYEGKSGICWVANEENHTDVLIGRFEQFDIEEANRTIAKLRAENPTIGTEIVRGGQFVNIPVRQPLSVLVSDGYAAIGDSAFMTVPVIGSGIANSFKAAKILADAILDDEDGAYNAHTLWKYQREFYKKLGSGLAPLGQVKLLLTRLDGKELDYIFEKNILTAEDMTIGAEDNNLIAMFSGISLGDIFTKLRGVIGDANVLKKIIRLGTDMAQTVSALALMPAKYDYKAVKKWAKMYDDSFNR